MIEYYLGDPIERTINGKTLRVEHKDNHTSIDYDGHTYELNNESIIDGLACAFEWGLNFNKT